MKEKALEVLKKLSENNYESYLVGGYPRDLILGRKTNDIDICTSATPKEILEIFDDVIVSDMQYGSVIIVYKGCKFDTTTFRKEIKYESNRKPVKIKYIKDIKKDLLRRDFTINTLCIDKDGNLLDILNIRSDLDNKLLKTVGNPRYRIKEDSLRILRCIRFATILDFDIEKKTKYFLTKYSYLLKSLSINRKKEELDKIFLSKNKERGRRLLLELNLTNALDLDKLATITMCTDLTGIWCQLEVDDIYPFTKVEKEQMSKLRELLKYDKIDNYLLYKYGLYLCTVYAEIKGIPRRKINTMYSKLPILTRRDINVTGEEISMILNKPPGKYIKDILDDIEVNILNSSIGNDKEEITKYIKDKYINIVALPFGSPYKKSHNNFKHIINSSYENVVYNTISTLQVGWEANYSPFSSNFDESFIKRIRAYDNNGTNFDITHNFNRLKNNKYISDGDKNKIVVPAGSEVNNKFNLEVIYY